MAVIVLSMRVCGMNAAIVPIIGPATPEKSAKSPVFKLKLFSSIIVFKFITVPSFNCLF